MKKLLVIRYGALGDLFHVSPSLQAVKQHFPETELHVLTSALYTSLLPVWPEVSRTWDYDKKTGWRSLWTLSQQLRQEDYMGIVNLHPSFKTWMLLRWVGCRRIETYRKQKFKVQGTTLRGLPRYHAVEDFYQPFRRLLSLPDLKAADLTPTFPLPARPKRTEETWVGIIPGVGGKRGNRAWPLEHFQNLIAGLLDKDPKTRILLIGGPEEQELAETLTGPSQVENHCGQHPFLETAQLLSQCHYVIGGDTGPLHLAAALGTPLISLFGPTDIRRTGALGHQPIHTLTPPETLDCWPCELPQCPLTGGKHLACMQGMTVEDVLQACEALSQQRAL